MKKIQKKFNKFIGFLHFINLFIGGKFHLEYDAKVLAGEGTKEAERMTGGEEGLKTKITETQQYTIGMVQQLLVPMIINCGMTDFVKSIDFDCITIILGLPKYQIGLAFSLNFPGLTQVLEGLIDNQYKR